LLGPAWCPVAERGQHRVLECDHVLVCAGNDTGAVGFAAVSGQHHPTGGGDLDGVAVEAVSDLDGGTGQTRADGVEVDVSGGLCKHFEGSEH
jgi:hypothetical protein